MSWPDLDTNFDIYFSNNDYGREINRVSPEGNVYGQMRFVRDWTHYVWWDGAIYRDYVVAGELNSTSELPSGRQTFGLVYEVKRYISQNEVTYDGYFYNSENPEDPWQKMKVMWGVGSFTDLPIPGIQVGAVHLVEEKDILVIWTGYQWERLRHSVLNNDEEELHLPPGFLDLLIPDVKVSYVNQYELVLEAIEGGLGAVFVGNDLITASPDTAVFYDDKAVNLIGGSLQTEDLEVDTEYWIYLANTKSTAYKLGDWDYRGRLFLSTTTPVNGYLGSGLGQYARLAGRIQTDSDGYFARELDISLISNRASLPEAFREYSDFVLEFTDESTLLLAKLDGTYGQMFIPDSLRYLGFDYTISRTDDWISWDEEVEGYVTREEGSLAINTWYYIYMAGRVDPFNFNEINPQTGRPWEESDADAEDNYVAVLDFRSKPFLSEQAPDHGRLAETWPGFYTRHIGQVKTDANGKFINSRSLSVIRQPTLNPSYFDGLAEITFVSYGETEFRVCRIRGTSGIVNVGGEAVETYDKTDSGKVHRALNSATVQAYNEGSPSDPLSNLNVVSTYTSQILYLYLANSRTLWDEYASEIFFSTTAPTGGYLSANWPGNQARWIANVRVSSVGKFTGSYIEDAVKPPTLLLDDENISSSEAWSSQKINAELQKLYFKIDAQSAFDAQKTYGCSVRLDYVDNDTIKLYPTTSDVTVVFPDLTYLDIPEAGISFDVSSSSAVWETFYYVYLDDSGLYISVTPPDTTYDAMKTLGTDSILVGYLSTGGLTEDITDITFSANSDFVRRNRKGSITNWVRDSANHGHFTDGATPLTLGPGNDCPLVRKRHSVEIGGTAYTIIDIVDDGEGTGEVELDGDPASASCTGVFGEVVESGILRASGAYEYDGSNNGSTLYATPDMTSNTTPAPAVASCYPTSSQAYYCFNQYIGSGLQVSDNPSYGATDIYFDAGSGNSYCINKWRINHGTGIGDQFRWVGSAKLYGSNVASPGPGDWTELDDESFTAYGIKTWSGYRTFYNDTYYRHHRLEITSIETYNPPQVSAEIYEIKFVAAPKLSDTDIVVCSSAASLQEDASLWSHISDMAARNLSLPSGSQVYGAFSFDDGATWHTVRSGSWAEIVKFDTVWKYHNGSSWQDASENSMDVALEEAIRDSDNQFSWGSIDGMSEDDWNDTGGFDPSDDYFDFAVGLKPDSDEGSPTLDGITGSRRIGHKHLAGLWNVYSFWDQSEQEWYEVIDDYADYGEEVVNDVILDLPGFFLPTGDGGDFARTETTKFKLHDRVGGQDFYCYPEIDMGVDSHCNGYAAGVLTIATIPSSISTNTTYFRLLLTTDMEPEDDEDIWLQYANGVFKVYWEGN